MSDPPHGEKKTTLAAPASFLAAFTIALAFITVRRRGVDVSYADDLFALPGFGGADGDSTTYIDRLELCREGGEPSVG